MSDEIILNEPVVTQQDRIEYALRMLAYRLAPTTLRSSYVIKIEDVLDGYDDSKILDWMNEQ
jgi:hypothetical protein